MTNDTHGEVLDEKVKNDVLLPKELHETFVPRIVLSDDSICLVLSQGSVSGDRPAFEHDIDSIRFKLIDKSLKLPEEVEDNRVVTCLESASSTVCQIHEVDTKDGHVSFVSLVVKVVTSIVC